MKKLFLILIFTFFPVFAFAGTITGHAHKDGVNWVGAVVRCYLYNNAIANVGALVDGDVTDANGDYTLTTANTQTHILIITDSTNEKKSLILIVTPDA